MANRQPRGENTRFAGHDDGPSKKTIWVWIGGAAGALVAILTTLAGLTDSIPKVWNAAWSIIQRSTAEKTADLTLTDARRVSARIDGAAGSWRRPETYEVLVEALVSQQPLKQCAADLDTGSSYGYFQALDSKGKEDVVDVIGYPLVRFKFYVPMDDFPKGAQLRIRCERYVSRWAPVDWPMR